MNKKMNKMPKKPMMSKKEMDKETSKMPKASRKEEASDWMKGAVKHPGALTKKAKAAGMTVAEYTNKVLKKRSKASAVTKKQATLAKTFAKTKKKK